LLIRTLQDQADRALADSQHQLHQSDMELRNCQERVRLLEKDRAKLYTEVAHLKDEISTVRGTLAQVDQEKDGLVVSVPLQFHFNN
jgi:septal ring factor EnvC (AmiA/AmiB activator)